MTAKLDYTWKLREEMLGQFAFRRGVRSEGAWFAGRFLEQQSEEPPRRES